MQYSRVGQPNNDDNEYEEPQRVYSKSIYVSHFISTWNSRGFEFGAVIFLSTIYPGTLLPMSVYALVRALAAIVFSPAVGRYIDRGNRLAVVRTSILGQRFSVTTSCLAFLYLLFFRKSSSQFVQLLLFLTLMLLACTEKLCIIMNTIAVERDWVVVIANENEQLLQVMNAQLRRIDLFCKLVAPLAIALLDGISTNIAITTTFIINLISVMAEYFLLAWVYKSTPNLTTRAVEGVEEQSDTRTSRSTCPVLQSVASSILQQARVYTRSHAFLPSLALSILYLTVLSFSGQMITYLLALDRPRIDSVHIAIMRTISTLLEMSSTFIAPLLIRRVGAVRAGIWSLSWQSLCLTPGVFTFWTNNNVSPAVQTYLFVVSVILSRIGLWSFDLTAQLLVQNSVDASQRGSFSATESSLQNFFELCTFAVTIIWSNPTDFRYPVTLSLVAVYTAAACYARFVRVERGHLLHMPPCCNSFYGYKAIPATSEDEDIEMMPDNAALQR